MANDSQILELKQLLDSDVFDVEQSLEMNSESEESIAFTRLMSGLNHLHSTLLKMVEMGKLFPEMNVVKLMNDKMSAVVLLGEDGFIDSKHHHVNSLRSFIEAIEIKYGFSIEESGFCLNVHEHLDDEEVSSLSEDLFEIFIQRRMEWSVDFYINFIKGNAASLSQTLEVDQKSLFDMELEKAIEEAHSRLSSMSFGEWITYISIEGSGREMLDQIVIDGNSAFPENFVISEIPLIDVFSRFKMEETSPQQTGE